MLCREGPPFRQLHLPISSYPLARISTWTDSCEKTHYKVLPRQIHGIWQYCLTMTSCQISQATMLSMATISPRVFRSMFIVLSALFVFVTLLQLPNNPTPHGLSRKQVNWSRFAYTQYATDISYLCNSLMIFEALHRLGSKADRLLMYPYNFILSEHDSSPEARLLRFARDEYSVKLKPIKVMTKGGGGGKSSQLVTKLQSKSECSTMVFELYKTPRF